MPALPNKSYPLATGPSSNGGRRAVAFAPNSPRSQHPFSTPICLVRAPNRGALSRPERPRTAEPHQAHRQRRRMMTLEKRAWPAPLAEMSGLAGLPRRLVLGLQGRVWITDL